MVRNENSKTWKFTEYLFNNSSLFHLFILFYSFGFLDFNAEELDDSSKVPGQENGKLHKSQKRQYCQIILIVFPFLTLI